MAQRDPQVAGLPELTEADLVYQNTHHSRVKAVRVNPLGLARVNSDRLRKGKPQLQRGDVNLANMGEDLDLTVGAAAPGATGDGSTSSPGAAAPLPTYVDNSTLKYFPPIRSQGSLNSCGPFSGTYYSMTYMQAMARNLDAKNGGDQYRLSPKFTYNMLNGGGNNGRWYYQAFELGLAHGCATWQEFAYDANYTAWCLNPTVWRNAIYRRFDTFGYVDGTDTDAGMAQVKQMLANGYILNFATYIYSWQTKAIGNDPATTADDAFAGKSACYFVNGSSGYHAMTVVGFNDDLWVDVNGNGAVDSGEKGAFRIANSWGTSWGEAGFAWMAYDALRTTSAVTGGPATGRIAGWKPTRAHWVTALASYQPVLLAEFTLNHQARNQISLALGISDPTQSTPATVWTPAALRSQGGAFAFNGTTNAVDATFVFDFSDIAPNISATKRFYLTTTDSTTAGATALKNLKLIDLVTTGEAASTEAPQTIDGATRNAAVTYAFSDGNLAPVASFTASASATYAPVTVQFNGTASTDADGAIASYSWNFGDGTTGSGPTASHAYANAGTYQATLTVTDDRGGQGSGTATIVVAQNPDLMLHVGALAVSVATTKGSRQATASVTVVSASGAPVAGATVTGQWTGAINGSSSALTGVDGKAVLASPRTKNTGAFTFTVTEIAKSGYGYDAAANTASGGTAQ